MSTAREAPESDEIPQSNTRVRMRQGAFLAAYGRSGRVSVAADAAGIDRSTHYDWMKSDPEYPALFAEAERLAADFIRDKAVEKAVEGWEEPVFHNGQVCGHIRKFSDRLHERLLEAKCPEFRQRHEHSGPGGGPIQLEADFNATDELISRIAGIAARAATPSVPEGTDGTGSTPAAN